MERTSTDRGGESEHALPSADPRPVRERGITSDMAHRYLAMPRNKLLIKPTTWAVKAPMKELHDWPVATSRVGAPFSHLAALRSDK